MEPALTWSQNYVPMGSIGLSALVALLPVATLLGLLAFWHVRAEAAALAGLLVASGIAIGVYHMPPLLTLASALYGAAFGLFPIGWIIVNALFIYALSVETGQFAVLQRQVAGVSADRRVQALLIAFSFGAFIEGAAGFGAPIAISGALLIGLGFRPLEAAKLTLIGNTAPVAYGALGTPPHHPRPHHRPRPGSSERHGRQAVALLLRSRPVLAHLGPVRLARHEGSLARPPVTGLSFGITQFVVSNFHGPWLVDIIGSFVHGGPRRLHAGVETPPHRNRRVRAARTHRTRAHTQSAGLARAGLDSCGISLRVRLPLGTARREGLSQRPFHPSFEVPWLHKAVLKVPPVAPKPEPESAVFAFNALSATGTALLCAGAPRGV